MTSSNTIASVLRKATTAVVIGVSLVALFGGVSAHAADDSSVERNMNRPGADYKVMKMFMFESYRDCRDACLRDKGKCKAWTYVQADRDRPALCYLKNAVPAPKPDICCISGVMPDKSRSAITEEPGGIAPTPVVPPTSPAAPPDGLSGGEPHGKIGEKYAKLGGPNSGIGPALGGETDAPYGGRCHAFRHGTICWHPAIGEAFTVWGAIHEKWVQFGRVEYGYPITDELKTPDGRGRFNHFRAMQHANRPEASIYWTPQTGAHAVWGAIRDAWAQQGWERGRLGYPTSDEHQDGKYRRVNFERGYIRWAPDTGIEFGSVGNAGSAGN